MSDEFKDLQTISKVQYVFSFTNRKFNIDRSTLKPRAGLGVAPYSNQCQEENKRIRENEKNLRECVG